MSEHSSLELKNNEPDKPDSNSIYFIAVVTIIFLAVSIAGLKWLHDYFEYKVVKSYELQEKPFSKKHKQTEEKFYDEVDKEFNKAIQ